MVASRIRWSKASRLHERHGHSPRFHHKLVRGNLSQKDDLDPVAPSIDHQGQDMVFSRDEADARVLPQIRIRDDPGHQRQAVKRRHEVQ